MLKRFPAIRSLILISLFCCHSAVIAARDQAAIATAHPLATEAGMRVLQQGGNAFDAAVAITAALAVVEPSGSGLGGGAFWLLHRAKDGQQVMLDGREMAPALAHRDMYLDKDGEVDRDKALNGPLAAGIPGVPAAIDYLALNYGLLDLKDSLLPAIEYAEEGFLVGSRYRKLAGYRKNVINRWPETAKIFLDQGKVPNEGYRIVQKDLATTLRRIANEGAKGFYQGEVARKLLRGVNAHGGHWQQQDLDNYIVRIRPPITARYHDMTIVSAAPPSSGGIVLAQALGILERFDLTRYDDVQQKHLVIEAMRRAYRDRAVYLGDPDFVDIPTERLLHKDYIDALSMNIDPEHASLSAEMGQHTLQQTGESTSHFSVMDKYGNRVAATLSINLPFGSGFAVPGTGVLLNNEMDDFSSKPNSANAYGLVGAEANQIEPGKRPLSSMSPTFIESNDRVAILGTPGGSRIISMVLLGILDFANNKPPRSWVSVPRYHHQFLPDVVQFEPGGLSDVEQHRLQQMGHQLKPINRRYGDMHAILWYKPQDIFLAASDPRGEGRAIVLTH